MLAEVPLSVAILRYESMGGKFKFLNDEPCD